MTGGRPNILLISTDQQRADHLGCYGAKVLKTPHIDSLAKRGIRFENAFVASPVCMPNRASIMTGRMPSVHGLRHNGLNLPLDSVTVADVLRTAGWKTGLVGKAHFQCVTDNPPLLSKEGCQQSTAPITEARFADGGRYDQEISERWRNTPGHDLSYPYYGFETVDLAIGHGDEVEGHYTQWLADRHPQPDSVRGAENALPGCDRLAPQAWRTALPEELYSTRYIEQRTIERLNSYAGDAEEPFFLWASFCDPHHPFTPPGRYWDLYQPEDVDLPRTYNIRNESDLPALLREQRYNGLARLTGTSALAVSEPELRAAIALTYGMIAMIDDAVGSILSALDSLGLMENTIVVFCSDHGDLMGDHGLIFKGPLHYQALVRTPLIWSDGRHQDAFVQEGPVTSIDLPASILQSAGVAAFNGMQGIPFIDNDGQAVSGRDSVMIEDEVQSQIPGHNIRGRARTLITDIWRLTLFDGIEQGILHNLREDPDEINNLWDDPKARAVRSAMIESLLRQMISHSETSPFPEYAA